MPPLDTAQADDWITAPAAQAAGKDDWITAPKAAEALSTPYSPDSIPAPMTEMPRGQSQVAADINAPLQGLVGGVGAGVAGAGRAVQAAGIQGTKAQLAVMDAIDRGDRVPQDKDVIGYQFLSPEQRAKAREQFTAASDELSKREPNAAIRAGDAIKSAAGEAFPVAPENEGIQTGVGRLIGGAAPAIAAGAVGGPAGVLGSLAVIGSQAYDSAYHDAIAKGASPEDAENAAGKSAVAQAAIMVAPIGRLLQRVPMPLRDGLMKTLVNLGQNGVEFGSANAIGTFANNYVAQQTYDPTRPLTQGTGQAGLEGTIAGLVIPAAVGAARTARSVGETVSDVMKAPDIDGAIAAATQAAEAPAAIAGPTTPDAASLYREAPAAIPPNAKPPVLPRILDLLNEDARVAANRPDFIPPDAAQPPPAPMTWGDLFAAKSGTGDVERPPTVSAETPPAIVEPPNSALRVSATEPAAIPQTSAEAKAVASAYYKMADDVGGTLTPGFTNSFIDKAESLAPQTPEGQAVAGNTQLTDLVDRLQALRDKPITLQGAQEIDERLGDLIDKEYGVKGLSKEGYHLLDLQSTFRNMILDAGPEDVTDGTGGFQALKQGRAAWAQAMKMSDLERILGRAELTDNPATSIKSGLRVLLSNPTRLRGYSPEEIDALKDAANRGVLGGILHVFGSRLIPISAGAIGLGAGPLSAAATAGIAYGGTAIARSAATVLQSRRLGNAMSVLGEGVPPAPAPTPLAQ